MPRVPTLIQWHTEKDGVLTFRNPGDVTDETPETLATLAPGAVGPEVEEDPAPTLVLKGGKRSATLIPPVAPPTSTEGSETT